MHRQPRTSHDLGIDPFKPRTSRRTSRAQQEIHVSNPFRYVSPNPNSPCIPNHILSQIQNEDYLCAASIKKIECRRPSNMVRNLRMMQQLAKMQEERYTGMLRGDMQDEHCPQPSPHALARLDAIFADDDVSLELNGFVDDADAIDDQLNLFGDSLGCDQALNDRQYIFYSNNEIEDNGMEIEEVDHFIGY